MLYRLLIEGYDIYDPHIDVAVRRYMHYCQGFTSEREISVLQNQSVAFIKDLMLQRVVLEWSGDDTDEGDESETDVSDTDSGYDGDDGAYSSEEEEEDGDVEDEGDDDAISIPRVSWSLM